MRIRRRHTPYILTALVAVIFLVNYLRSPNSQPSDSQLSEHVVIQQFSQKQFDENGILVHRVEAATAEVNDHQMELTQPVLETLHQQVSWRISAARASSQDHLKHIQFSEQVEIRQPQQQALSLTTESLSYDVAQKRLLSNQPVLLKDQFDTLIANRLMLDITSLDIELSDGVSGTQHDNK